MEEVGNPLSVIMSKNTRPTAPVAPIIAIFGAFTVFSARVDK
jgi:hypothetical protein